MKILNWEKYFLGLAKLSGMRSKDPNTKVGAVIANKENRVMGIGYNGMPNGDDESFPWEREGELKDTKYPYVVHAEMNAILNSTQQVKDCSLYVTLFPCANCAKFIVQAGIKKITFISDIYKETVDHKIAENILITSGVELIKAEDFELIIK